MSKVLACSPRKADAERAVAREAEPLADPPHRRLADPGAAGDVGDGEFRQPREILREEGGDLAPGGTELLRLRAHLVEKTAERKRRGCVRF
jgi:hypothetical protein